MKVPVALVALSALIISTACGPADQEPPAADDDAPAASAGPSAEDGIAEASVAFAARWNAGDGAAIAALYSSDAMLFPPGAEPVSGSAAIAEFWTGAIPEGAQVALETLEVHAGDGGALEVGSFVITGADGAHVDHGKYIVHWTLVDGTWKLHRDIWNSSMEAAEE